MTRIELLQIEQLFESPTLEIVVIVRGYLMLQILPLGDSITDGYEIPGGYRWRLGNRLRGAGFAVNFLGSLVNGPEDWGDRHHEGHSGWRIDQLQVEIEGWLVDSNPNWILLMIGTNDVAQEFELATAPGRLEQLIHTLFSRCPQVNLGVATIPPILDFFPVGSALDAKVQVYNAGVRSLVQQFQAQGQPIILAEAYPIFAPDDLPDGVHPNRTGQDKLGELWFQTITTALGDSPGENI